MISGMVSMLGSFIASPEGCCFLIRDNPASFKVGEIEFVGSNVVDEHDDRPLKGDLQWNEGGQGSQD